jgi:hypothetical protein
VRLQVCDSDDHPYNDYKQNWYYRPDLTLAPVGSIMGGTPMCVDAGPNPMAGTTVTLQPCRTPVPARQRWYHNNTYNYELAASTSSGNDGWGLSGLCMNVASPRTSGSRIVLGVGANCRSSTYNSRQTFGTAPKVGPGQASSRRTDCTANAGYPCVSTQLLNHSQPSRCLDMYQTFMATMECVQHPDPSQVRWNQRWRLPAAADGPIATVGPIVTVDPAGTTYCLTASAELPTQQLCDPRRPTATQKFGVYRNTGNEFTMYRIVDVLGRCLTYPNGTDPIDENAYRFYWNVKNNWKVHLDRCVNSTSDPRYQEHFNYASIVRRQKWDAPFLLPTSGPTTAPAPTTAPTPAPPARIYPLINVTEIPPR